MQKHLRQVAVSFVTFIVARNSKHISKSAFEQVLLSKVVQTIFFRQIVHHGIYPTK